MIIEVDFNETAKTPKPKFLLKKQESDTVFCRHTQLEIDHHQRILLCEKCGKVLDAYDYVYELAVKETRLFSDIKLLQKDVEDLTMQRNALKAQVSHLKSDVKKATRKNVTTQTIVASDAGKKSILQIKQNLKP